jgi:hypothetical protein
MISAWLISDEICSARGKGGVKNVSWVTTQPALSYLPMKSAFQWIITIGCGDVKYRRVRFIR